MACGRARGGDQGVTGSAAITAWRRRGEDGDATEGARSEHERIKEEGTRECYGLGHDKPVVPRGLVTTMEVEEVKIRGGGGCGNGAGLWCWRMGRCGCCCGLAWTDVVEWDPAKVEMQPSGG